MKRFQIFLAAFVMGMTLVACGDDDETLSTAYQDPTNNFIPNPSASDETSVLRRQFKEKYDSYLLFTDTLQHYQVGIDINGDPRYFTEVVNILYSVGQTAPIVDRQTYTYFTSFDEQKAVVEYMEQYILNHITGKLRPFSWFLAKTIENRSNSGSTTRPYAIAGQRTIIVSLGQALRLTESGKRTLATRILSTIIGQLAANNSDAFDEFYAVSGSLYGQAMSVPEGKNRNQFLAENGFVSPATFLPNIDYPSQRDDLSAYSLIAISYTDEKIAKDYGQYPLVMKKVEIVKRVLTALGYVF